jgi:hypothetical protein
VKRCLVILLCACGSTTVSKLGDCVFQPVDAHPVFAVGNTGSADVFDEVAPEQVVDVTDFVCTNTSRDGNTRAFKLMSGMDVLVTMLVDADTTNYLTFATPLRVAVRGMAVKYDLGGTGECTLSGLTLDLLRSDVADVADCGI